MNNVFAIIVTYNPDIRQLKTQFEMLVCQVSGIVYVDNNSESCCFLDSIDNEKVIIIKNRRNLGLAKAQNQGIEIAQERGADFVLLLDQDSEPSGRLVENLLKCFYIANAIRPVALIGPSIRDMFHPEDNVKYEGVILNSIFIKRVPIERVTEVSYCIASGSLIPLPVIREVGGMLEEFFIDSIDMEWCLRAKKSGFYTFQTNTTILNHYLGNGKHHKIKSHNPKREYYITRNSLLMIRLSYIPLGYRIRKIFTTLGRVLVSLFNFEYDYLKSELMAVRDSIKY